MADGVALRENTFGSQTGAGTTVTVRSQAMFSFFCPSLSLIVIEPDFVPVLPYTTSRETPVSEMLVHDTPCFEHTATSSVSATQVNVYGGLPSITLPESGPSIAFAVQLTVSPTDACVLFGVHCAKGDSSGGLVLPPLPPVPVNAAETVLSASMIKLQVLSFFRLLQSSPHPGSNLIPSGVFAVSVT